jgi:thymidylate synthase
MRIYSRFKEAYKETERELIEMGVDVHPETMQDLKVAGNDDYATKELQGYGYVITSGLHKDDDFMELGGNFDYAVQESEDRVDPAWLNPGLSYLKRKEVWDRFLHEGKMAYIYNERFRDQLGFILQELQQRPNTRQAILTVYDKHLDMQNIGGVKRIPCSLYYQFLRRKRNGVEVLDAIYTMRSCDIYTHMLYDMWLTMELQETIAGELGIDSGHFTHFIGSLHCYRKDYLTKGVF